MGSHLSLQGSSLVYSHSVSNHPENDSFERHCHDYYELLYVVRGKGRYIVESMEYPLLPNTLLLLRPYEFHDVCPHKECVYERYVIHFKASALLDAVAALPMICQDRLPSAGVYIASANISEAVQSTISGLDEVSRLFADTSMRNARDALLVTELNRILLLLSLAKREEVAEPGDELIPRVIAYLNLHIERPISLDRLAQRFFVSKYYLCHAFRRQTGISIFTYIHTKRIAMAQQLLENGEPATSVAYQVGFQNYSSFYRTFCKLTGHAPVYGREERGINKKEDL